ncbi:MAG: HD domain-containing protein [Bryobacteraceae bacterium]
MPDCLHSVRQILAAACFAAERHAAQRRKGQTAEPYVNHLLEVAELLARTATDLDTNLIVAALLHDTIEDAGVTRAEIAARFGEDVAALVAEVTDDKSLPKEVRKAQQVEHATGKSPRAQALGTADKIANIRSIATSPPANWTFERRVAYVRWAREVVRRYGHVNGPLADEFQRVSAQLQEWEKSGGTKVFF